MIEHIHLFNNTRIYGAGQSWQHTWNSLSSLPNYSQSVSEKSHLGMKRGNKDFTHAVRSTLWFQICGFYYLCAKCMFSNSKESYSALSMGQIKSFKSLYYEAAAVLQTTVLLLWGILEQHATSALGIYQWQLWTALQTHILCHIS